MSTYSLCVCLLADEIQIYKSHNQTLWDSVPIKGEVAFKHHGHKNSLKTVLQECSQRLNFDDQLTSVLVNILYVDYTWLIEALQQLQALKNHKVQVLQWQTLVDYSRQNHDENVPELLTKDWITQYILPLTCLENSWQEHQKLIDALTLQKQIQQEQLQHNNNQTQANYAQQLAQLQAERQRLQGEVKEVQQKLAAIQRPNLENLLSYLPSIFKNFWNTVRPDDLANIAGLLDVPSIPSPYHNPSLNAIQAKKRQFLALAETEQKQIIGFCRQLNQHYDLQIHLEFQPIIGALD